MPRSNLSKSRVFLQAAYWGQVDLESESFLTEAHPNPQKSALVFLKALVEYGRKGWSQFDSSLFFALCLIHHFLQVKSSLKILVTVDLS